MRLKSEDILKIFCETDALLEGHFILTSGLHSRSYFQCAKVFQYPWHAETLCREIAAHFRDQRIDVVISPAVGGIVFGQEVARLLKVRAIFAERAQGSMTLRRGFSVSPGERVLLAEDVTTTGGSVREVLEYAENQGADIVGVTAVVDRSSGRARFGVPYFSLFQMAVTNYDPSECPLCASGSQAVKPGSRSIV